LVSLLGSAVHARWFLTRSGEHSTGRQRGGLVQCGGSMDHRAAEDDGRCSCGCGASDGRTHGQLCGCRLSNAARTPGAINLLVTQATIGRTICVTGWTATVRRSVAGCLTEQGHTPVAGRAAVRRNRPLSGKLTSHAAVRLTSRAGGSRLDPVVGRAASMHGYARRQQWRVSRVAGPAGPPARLGNRLTPVNGCPQRVGDRSPTTDPAVVRATPVSCTAARAEVELSVQRASFIARRSVSGLLCLRR